MNFNFGQAKIAKSMRDDDSDSNVDSLRGCCLRPPLPCNLLSSWAAAVASSLVFTDGLVKGIGGETIMRFDDTNPEAEKQVEAGGRIRFEGGRVGD
eukprot:754585-Hanusia_phi.AAC.1